mgnify:CR=1 FL=1
MGLMLVGNGGWAMDALVRRAAGGAEPGLRVGTIALDPGARSVTCNGMPVELAPREFALLNELMLQAGRVLSKGQLEERIYAWGEEIASNAVEVHIHHLRRKLSPAAIRTVRGVGYLMPKSGDG